VERIWGKGCKRERIEQCDASQPKCLDALPQSTALEIHSFNILESRSTR
jgi:hypothetical protein